MTRRDNHILILIDAQSSSCLSRYSQTNRPHAPAARSRSIRSLAAVERIATVQKLELPVLRQSTEDNRAMDPTLTGMGTA
jgi:RNase adaptor protein for sRNA GlmZ degradation